jgi:hypothetical protein
MTTKRILCLANSKKLAGRCIAGREVRDVTAGPWIRPVSARPSEEVSENERQYSDGSDPQLLDVIDVPLLQAVPHACQIENWRLDPGYYWSRVRRAGWAELLKFAESPTTLWVNGHSTYHGHHDEIPQAIADALPGSLYLIRVDQVTLRVFAPSEAFGNPKRRVQAQFSYRSVPYRVWVTDPVIERAYLAQADGYYRLGESCLTMSLGEPFQKNDGSWCRYKLVAAIVQRQGATQP